MNTENQVIRRGDIYYADLNPVIGSEQGGIRPCWFCKTMWATATAPPLLWRRLPAGRKIQPSHPCVGGRRGKWSLQGFHRAAGAGADHRPLPLREYMGALGQADMEAVDSALEISFGLDSEPS